MTGSKVRVNWDTAELEMVPRDNVNSPDHYTVGGFEAIDVIEAKLTPEELRGYYKGNALKYLMRANYKGKHSEDCAKAQWYLNRLLKDETVE